MVIKKEKRKMTFRGVNIIVPTNQYTCKVCGIEAGTVKQAADIQRAILEAYRNKHGTWSRYPLKFSLR